MLIYLIKTESYLSMFVKLKLNDFPLVYRFKDALEDYVCVTLKDKERILVETTSLTSSHGIK